MDAPRPFVVLCAPRSRSAWTARFLSYGGWHCGHEQLRYARSLSDVKNWFAASRFASAETTGLSFWRLLERIVPGIKIITIRREPSETVASLVRLGFGEQKMKRAIFFANAKLDQIEHKAQRCTRVEYDSLGTEKGLSRLWIAAFGGEIPFDLEWAQQLSSVNIQMDVRPLIRYLVNNSEAIEKLERQAKAAELANFLPRKSRLGLKLSVVPFEQFLAQSRGAFALHAIMYGEKETSFAYKNVPLYRELENKSRLLCCVARNAEEIVGYLVVVLSPSLNSDSLRATNGPFFASPSYSGLGLALQRFALSECTKRAVKEIWWQEGEEGTKLGSLAKRVGAVSAGSLFRKELQ